MIPKLHKKGSSFKGAAQYLLHDKQADTSERVSWTETRNLATLNPQAAWRVMAATALEQNRLKEDAGIKATGRKSKSHVLHLTLSWHPEEKDGLTKDEMVRAALGAIRALGAQDHQALLVSHDDEPQPHVHVLLNRVSPADGRMLSSSKEKLALSAWAEAYERERGEILCEERVLNNAARARGQFTRAEKEKPRHVYELEAANQNHPRFELVRKVQAAKDAELLKHTVEQKARHRAEWSALEAVHAEEKGAIRKRTTLAEGAVRKGVARELRGDWRALFRKQETDRKQFLQRENTTLGRASNALRQVDWRGLLGSGRRGMTIKKAFSLLSSSGERSEALRRQQEKEYRSLEKREAAEVRAKIQPVRAKAAKELLQARKGALRSRDDLRLRQALESASVRAKWKTRRSDRLKAWRALERGARSSAGPAGGAGRSPNQVRSTAERFMDRMRKTNRDRDPDNERDR